MNTILKEIKAFLNNRLIILFTIFFVATFFLKFIFFKNNLDYRYTELQKSHFENGKYKRDNTFWMERKTENPLNGLVYDYAENGERIDFGYLVNGYQDGVWTFFHDNGQPSMENIYKNGKFIKTTHRWDMYGQLINNED